MLQYFSTGNTPPFDATVTAEDIKNGFRVWRESTSTSPSGIHLGHYKATTGVFDDHTPDRSANSLAEPTFSDTIMGYHALLLNKAVECGHIFDRWKQVDSCMLEKLPGKPYLHKLRVIHLYEADLNLLLGIWSRRLTWNGEQANAYNPEQWGSRPKRRAIDVAVLKTLSYDFAALTRTDLGTFDNDAKSCYDRIIPALAMLRSRQLGMPKEACHLHGLFLEQARYHVKTALGTSTAYYSHTTETPIDGTGQGAKPSPVLWLGQSTAVMDLMNTPQLVMPDPRNVLRIARQNDGYVDDVTGWTNYISQLLDDPHANDQTATQTLRQLQEVAQRWETLLTSTGGQLELSKCFYYIVQWTFDRHGQPHMVHSADLDLQVKDSCTGQSIPIKQQSTQTPHRTLGVYLAPTGTMSMAEENLRKKATTFAIRTRSGRLPPGDAEVACRLLYRPSMGYMLPATTMTERTLRSIQHPPIAAFTAAMGYNRNMPASVLHGPRRLGGLGLPDLYIEQGTEHVLFLLRHVRPRTIIGETIQLLIDWYQLYSGQTNPIMEYVTMSTELYVPGEWINATRQYLRDADQHLKLHGAYTPTLRCAGDRCLMQDALGWTQQPQLLTDINNCRLYLRAETLADITTADGTELVHDLVYNERGPETMGSTHYRTPLLWPRQPRPGIRAWKRWRKFLQVTYSYSTRTLRQPLGAWQQPHHHRQWTVQYELTRNCIRLQHTNGWTRHRILQKQRRAWTIDPTAFDNGTEPTDDTDTQTIPTHWLTPIPDDNRCAVPRDLAQTQPNPTSSKEADGHPPDPLTAYHHSLATLPAWSRHYTGNVSLIPAKYRALTTALRAGAPLYLGIAHASNGSRFAYGWTLGTAQCVYLTGYGPVEGQPVQSKRATICCAISALFVSGLITAELQLPVSPQATMTLHVNDDTLVKAARHSARLKHDPLQPDWDVRVLLANTLHHTTIPVRYRNTRIPSPGSQLHQAHALDMANIALSQSPAGDTGHGPTRWNPVGLYNFQGMIKSSEGTFLRDSVQERDYLEFLLRNRGWTWPLIQAIDWDSRQAALPAAPPATFRYVVKASHGWLPTQVQQHKIDPRTKDSCPLCGQRETQAHIFQCPAQATWRTKYLQSTQELLRTQGTDDTLRCSIVYCLGRWLSNSTSDDTYKGQGDADTGWERTMYGYLPTRWSTLQTNTQCKHTARGNGWARAFILHNIQHAHNAWKIRCDLVHTDEEPGTPSAACQALQQKIRGLCADRSQLLAYDRTFFELDLDAFFHHTNERRLRSWYDTARQLYRDSLQRAQAHTRHGVLGIRHYFQPREPD
jgi:hypothetical protein